MVGAPKGVGGSVNPKTTGLLALLALGLGAFVFFYEIEGDSSRRAAIEEAKKVHVGFEAAEITAVAFTTLDEIPTRFERSEGGWQLVAPIASRADGTALDAIAHALANMPREGSLEAGGSLEGFGLGEGAQTIRFEVAGEIRGLRIGRSTPVGGHLYVARLGDDEVGFVASYRVNAFKRNLADLRDRRIFQFEAGEIRTLRVLWPGEESGEESEVALARDDLGQWQMGVPLVGPADQEVVRDLLSNLAYLRAKTFVDEPGALLQTDTDERSREALRETALRFHWSVEGGHLERGARIAGEVDGGRLIEAPGGRLYTIPAERLDDFPRRLVDYRSKRVSSFDISAARRLEMEFPLIEEAGAEAGRAGVLRVVAELAESGWSSSGASFDADRASHLVRTLAGLRAVDIFADEMGSNELASVGLDPARATIRVEGGSDPAARPETLADLSIGYLDPDRGLFAKPGDAPTIFLLSAGAADDLPISAERYRADFEATANDEGRGPAADPEPGALFSLDPLEGVDLP